MLNKLVLLLGLVLTVDGQSEVIPKEYIFNFNSTNPIDTATQTTVLNTVTRLVGANGVVQSFSVGTLSGFFLFNVTDAAYKSVFDSAARYGSFQQDVLYRVSPISPDIDVVPIEQVPLGYIRNQTANPFKKPCCANKRCCGRPVSYWYNYNLDQLDDIKFVRDGTFCTPIEECDKINVFVFDSGIWNPAPWNQHPEFEGRVKQWYDVGFGFNEDMGSGTHAAGIIGAKSYSVSPNVNLHSVKVIKTPGITNVIAMINGFIAVHTWMLANPTARAVVLLPGIICPPNWILDWIVNYMATGSPYKDRLLFVTSAGDVAGQNACKCNYASNLNVLSVGAVDSSMTVYNPTNIGSCIDVFASGVRVLSTWLFDGGNVLTGSRQAAALAAGVAAQYWVENPSLTSLAIRNLINTNPTSAIHVTTTIVGLPAGIPSKVIKYQCPGKCCAYECP